jgi:aminopeptidase N
MRTLFFLLFSILTFSQQTKSVDFLKCEANVMPDFDSKSIGGKISYEFKIKSIIDTIRIDAKNMEFAEVVINGKNVKHINNNKELLLFEGFKKGKNKLTFQYSATPKQTLYFTGDLNEVSAQNSNLQIWTQGQGRYTSHWLPSFDDVNEKVVFNITVSFHYLFKVLSNGKSKNDDVVDFESKTFSFKMEKPMSSYLVMLAIGNFEKQETKRFSLCEIQSSRIEGQ